VQGFEEVGHVVLSKGGGSGSEVNGVDVWEMNIGLNGANKVLFLVIEQAKDFGFDFVEISFGELDFENQFGEKRKLEI
jgi:hypothetical protein